MRALVPVVADIDLEAVCERFVIHLVRAEAQQHLGSLRRDIRHAARHGEVEHQRAHARRTHVEHVEAVPTILHEAECVYKLQCRCERTLGQSRTA